MRFNSFGSRAYTYKVIVPPSELPVSVEEVKAHLKIFNTLEDNLLEIYIQAATSFAEKFTKRDIIQRTYKTYRDSFPSGGDSEGYYYSGEGTPGFELKKSPLVSVSSINYLDIDLNSQTIDPLNYYVTMESDYSEILLNPGKTWPTKSLNRIQSINIDFVCGLFADRASVSGEWKNAILQHVALLYSDRGDCSCDDSGVVSGSIPKSSMAFYMSERIISL